MSAALEFCPCCVVAPMATCKCVAVAAGKDEATAEAGTGGQVGVDRGGQPGREFQSGRLLKD